MNIGCKCSTKSYNYLINTPDKITFQVAFRIQILECGMLSVIFNCLGQIGFIVELEVILSMNKLATFLECNKDKENSLNAWSSDANSLGNSL